MKQSILIIFLLLISGCSSQPDVAVNEKQTMLPKWFLAPPQNDELYLYGIGSAKNSEEAIQQALENLLSKLSITLESSFTMQQTSKKDLWEYFSTTSSLDIKSSVAKMKINNYEVIQMQKMQYNEYIALVRVQKAQFISAHKRSLENLLSTIQMHEKVIANSDPLTRDAFYQDASKLLSKKHNIVMILATLDKNFNTNRYLQYMQHIDKERYNVEKKMNFVLVNGTKNKLFSDAIRSSLSQSFHLVSFIDMTDPNQLYIHLSHKTIYKKVRGIFLADVTLTVTLKDQKNNIIKTQQLQLKGYSVTSKQDALKDAAFKLKDKDIKALLY